MGTKRTYDRSADYQMAKWHKWRNSENPDDRMLTVKDGNWHSSNYRSKFTWSPCCEGGVFTALLQVDALEDETKREFEDYAISCARSVWSVGKYLSIAQDMWVVNLPSWDLFLSFRLDRIPPESEVEKLYRLLKRLDTPCQ